MEKVKELATPRNIASVLLVLSVIYLGPIGLGLLIAFRPKWWKNLGIKIATISWAVFYAVAVISAIVGPHPAAESIVGDEAQLLEDSNGLDNDANQQDDADASAEDEDNSTEQKEAPEKQEEVKDSGSTNSASSPQSDSPQASPNTSSSASTGGSSQTTTPGSASSQNSNTPTSTSHYVEGYCKDGTKVYGDPTAKGKANVCYGHKGWRDEY